MRGIIKEKDKLLLVLSNRQKEEEAEEELLPEEVTAALKLVRKFAQKNCSENYVLSLRNIEREITVKNKNQQC